jgi:hypothetical protein
MRAWLVSGEFEELYTTVNFAKRLFNIGMGGVCVETTGRLRPDVRMSVEVRFDALNSMLRSQARIVWVHTETVGGSEIHRAGLQFVGRPEITKPVREYLLGGRAEVIAARREADYQALKQKSDEGKTGPRKGSLLKKLAVTLLILALLYVGSFWALVFVGRTGPQDAGMRWRYPASEELLKKVYGPLERVFRKAGMALVYDDGPR